MKLVKYEDESGWKKQSFIKDNMSISQAHTGIEHNPPDVSRLDWDLVQKELNNLLIDRDLITLKDVSQSNNLSNTILSIIQPKLVALYKEQTGYVKSPNGIPRTKEAQK